MWITLTESDISTAITGPELIAARTAAKATGQSDPVPEIIAQVTREVRARVAACANNSLGPAGMIPDECKSAAIDIAVYRLCKRVPGTALLKEERSEANKLAIAFLKEVAACGVALQQPDNVSEEVTSGPGVQIVNSTRRIASRAQLSGL